MFVVKTMARILTFRASREELHALDRRHLIAGLLCTWVVGMGRYWDEPGAIWVQKLGLGSLVYIFVLAALLWAVVKPLRLDRWRYRDVLTFVALTSPPAILYAVPVEMFTELNTAAKLNAAFLAVVAVWRVALWLWYLLRSAGLSVLSAIVCELLPLCLIVVSLVVFNLEHATFDIMGGLRNRTSKDEAYLVVVCLSVLATGLFFPLLIAWGVLVQRAQRREAPPAAARDA